MKGLTLGDPGFKPGLPAFCSHSFGQAIVSRLSAPFRLTPTNSVRNIIRRADGAVLARRTLRDETEAVRHRIPKTEIVPLLWAACRARGQVSSWVWCPCVR